MSKYENLLAISKLASLAAELRLESSLLAVETLTNYSPEKRRECELKLLELNLVLDEWKTLLEETEAK